MPRKWNRKRESGAALAEYGLLVAGVTMVSLVAVSVLGSKVGGLIGSVASLLPGAYHDQNAPVQVGQIVETITTDINGDDVREVVMDAAGIGDSAVNGQQGQNTPRLGASMQLDAHGTSHLYQLGSPTNPNH